MRERTKFHQRRLTFTVFLPLFHRRVTPAATTVTGTFENGGVVRVTGDAAKQRDQVGNSLFGVVVFEGATEGGVFDTFLLDTLIVDAREVMRRNPSARRRR